MVPAVVPPLVPVTAGTITFRSWVVPAAESGTRGGTMWYRQLRYRSRYHMRYHLWYRLWYRLWYHVLQPVPFVVPQYHGTRLRNVVPQVVPARGTRRYHSRTIDGTILWYRLRKVVPYAVPQRYRYHVVLSAAGTTCGTTFRSWVPSVVPALVRPTVPAAASGTRGGTTAGTIYGTACGTGCGTTAGTGCGSWQITGYRAAVPGYRPSVHHYS